MQRSIDRILCAVGISVTNWPKLINDHHRWAHSHDGFELVTREGATAEELVAMERQFGIEFPTEFRELYSTYNGIGLASSDSTDVDYWSFLPLDMIPDFAETIRNWFRETHPDAAARFVPFYDWKNGDGLGYLFDENGKAIPGLCSFEHELYSFDAEQELDEFLEVVPVTIKDFLQAR